MAPMLAYPAMVINRWNEEGFARCATLLEQRVYSSQLLGQDPELVMHGGGNTSVKSEVTNLFGRQEKVLYIKGSGWDLATIEARGFPAVKLEGLLELRELSSLADEPMMNQLRTLLIDAKSPDPSVEALLHAFLPHRFVDHTHADAILTLTNQPEGEKWIRELFGNRVGIVPYVMPGFDLAKACAEVFERDPDVEGLVLLRHGIFSFGDSAKESYSRMIRLVQAAEKLIEEKASPRRTAVTVPSAKPIASWMQALRTEFLSRGFRCLLSLDNSSTALELSGHPEARHLTQRGPLTPDHVIRTKRLPLFLESIEELPSAFDNYAQAYQNYFEHHCASKAVKKQRLDPWPRVVVVPGLGFVCAGSTRKDADIARDIYHHTASCILRAERMRGYEALPEGDLFDVEYWVLEQAKLKLAGKRLPLTGKSALVTGASSGIGLAIARELVEQGAFTFVLDLKKGDLPKGAFFIQADVTHRAEVATAIETLVATVGGMDILVVNAGIFPGSGEIETIAIEEWERSLNVNLTGSFHCVAESLKWMKSQKAGGDIVFVSSKNVPAPGKGAGAYSAAKAGQAQLARVCALEAGGHGIRVNVLHPHLILDTPLWSGGVLEQRASAYGMSVEQYKTNNLLKTSLESRDVASAVFALVSGLFAKTTGAQIPVDGGSDRTL